jgi:hypothetical protein
MAAGIWKSVSAEDSSMLARLAIPILEPQLSRKRLHGVGQNYEVRLEGYGRARQLLRSTRR